MTKTIHGQLIFLALVIMISLAGCNQATPEMTSTPAPTGVLTPYRTRTPSPILPSATFMVTMPVTPAPTVTPFLYTVKNDDTMLGIAYHFGISLAELQAANPDVDPHYMSVGMQLVIPIGGEIPQVLPTPTAVPMHVEQPLCYSTGDGGVLCIVAIRNDLEVSVENLSVWIGLYSPQGENIANQVAFTQLNILRPGEKMPLMANFAAPLPDEFEAKSELLSGIVVAANDTRYLDVQVKTSQVVISLDGQQATVSGEVILPGDNATPSQEWALAVAYDAEGNIVGARKWESSGETQFEITVYSLAGKIDHVDVLAEVRP